MKNTFTHLKCVNNSRISGSQQDYLVWKSGSPQIYLVVIWPRFKQNNVTNTTLEKCSKNGVVVHRTTAVIIFGSPTKFLVVLGLPDYHYFYPWTFYRWTLKIMHCFVILWKAPDVNAWFVCLPVCKVGLARTDNDLELDVITLWRSYVKYIYIPTHHKRFSFPCRRLYSFALI